MNASMNQSCDQFVIAIHEPDISNCDNGSDLSTILEQCDTYNVQVIHYFLQMIASFVQRPSFCTNPIFVYRLYLQENFSALVADLQNGSIDLYPMPMSLTTVMLKRYFVIPAATTASYGLVANIGAKFVASNLATISFLSSPFSPLTWTLALASLLLAKLIEQVIRQSGKADRLRSTIKTHSFFVLLPLTGIGVLYSSALKAIMIRPTTSPPFGSIAELIELVERFEVQFLVEDKTSIYYRLLTDVRQAPTNELKELVRQIGKTTGALRVTNMLNICGLMETSSHYIYLGHDKRLMSECEFICPWQFPLNIPKTQAGYFASKNITISTQLLMASSALPNYHDILLHKTYKETCDNRTRENHTISSGALFYGYGLIVASWIFGLFLLTIEFVVGRRRRSWTLRHQSSFEILD